jgi:uncharacterized membrane protein HdeD (DUF308 family)
VRRYAVSGLVVSVAGAYLDFSSGYGMSTPSMEAMQISTESLLLYLLGAVVLGTGISMVLPLARARMRLFGGIMEALGIVMALASTFLPNMEMGTSDLMLVVGALMILNGALMGYSRKTGMTGLDGEDVATRGGET